MKLRVLVRDVSGAGGALPPSLLIHVHTVSVPGATAMVELLPRAQP